MAPRRGSIAHNFQDYTGQRFGRLICLSYFKVRSGKVTKVFWSCRCDCGAKVDVRAGDLRTGDTRSCGCLHREQMSERFRTHGKTGTSEHWVWLAMIQRCTNKKAVNFKNYGGRGIYVCKRWRSSFENFMSDMGPRPSPKHSIERKDNDGPYSPKNCVWADRKTQSKNRRDSVVTEKMLVELRGIRARGESVKAWAEKRGISYSTARKAAKRAAHGGG